MLLITIIRLRRPSIITGDHDTFKQPYKEINHMIRIIGSTNLKRCRPLLYNVSFGFTPRPCGKLILYFFLVLGPTSNGHLGLYPCNKKIKRRRRKLWSCFREYVEARGTNSTSVMHLSMIYKSKITSLVLLRVFL